MWTYLFICPFFIGGKIMCTCLSLKNNDFYFGRNLDLDYSFNEQVAITPRRYEFKLKNGNTFYNNYALIGMATVYDEYPLYAEAINEKGLGMAGLNYPFHDMYPEPREGKNNISPFEFIPYILGQCVSVKEAREILKDLWLDNVAYSDKLPLTVLHFMIADKDECIVIEHGKDGLMIYDNPYGVMTNNPSFPYHLENIKNYMHLSSDNSENRISKNIDIKPYGEGMGAIGLPGDFSSASRFIKTSFLKLNSYSDTDENSNVAQFFHILDSVVMVRGSVITGNNHYDITTYSCCANASKGIYYYKTYDNSGISAVNLFNEDLNGNKLIVYPLNKELMITYHN